MYKKEVTSTCGGSYCCLESPGVGINPLGVENTFPAGGACAGYCDGMVAELEDECLLATAYMPMQEYRAGFCPNEALACGTLFPELVSTFCKEDALWN